LGTATAQQCQHTEDDDDMTVMVMVIATMQLQGNDGNTTENAAVATVTMQRGQQSCSWDCDDAKVTAL